MCISNSSIIARNKQQYSSKLSTMNTNYTNNELYQKLIEPVKLGQNYFILDIKITVGGYLNNFSNPK